MYWIDQVHRLVLMNMRRVEGSVRVDVIFTALDRDGGVLGIYETIAAAKDAVQSAANARLAIVAAQAAVDNAARTAENQRQTAAILALMNAEIKDV